MAWEDLSPEEQASWKEAYKQGTAASTAAPALPTPESGFGSLSLGALGQTLQHPLGLGTPGGLRGGMAQAQQNLANVPNAIAQSVFGLTPALGGSVFGTAGEMGAGLASQALNVLTSPFRTPEGAAMAAATGPLGRATQGMRFLPRLGINTAVQAPLGAGVAAATGGDLNTGALEGATAGAFQAAGSKLAEKFLKTTAGDVYAVSKAAVAEVDTPTFAPFGRAISGGGKVGTIEAVNRLANQRTGLKALSDAFQQTEDTITRAINPSRPIALQVGVDPNKLAALGLDPSRIQQVTGQPIVGTTVETRSLQGWLDELKLLKARVSRAQRGRQDAVANMEWKRVEAIEDGLKEAIGDPAIGGSPALKARYEEAVQQYGHGKDVLDILHDSGFVRSSAGGGTSAMLKLQQYLLQNGRDYPEADFPDLYKAAFRGANPMLKADKAISLMPPRFYGGPGGARVSETIPKMTIPIRVGAPSPSPIPPRVPGTSGLLPLSGIELLKSLETPQQPSPQGGG